jgi:arylamine N-acetyltransferase
MVTLGFGKDMDHMSNVVTLDGADYLVEVGYSKHTPSKPLPLLAEGTVMATKHGDYRSGEHFFHTL